MLIVLDARAATGHFPGIGRYIVNLAQALPRVAPDIPLTLLRDPTAAGGLLLPDLPAADCPISPFSLRQQWLVPKALRRLEAGLYHSPYYLMPYRLPVPAVVTFYDLIPLIYPENFTALQRLIFGLAHRLAAAASRAILTISEATRNDLIRYLGLDAGRITVTPLAADARFKPQPPAVVAAIRQKYGLPAEYVLYVGSNKPHKNLPRLISAFDSLGGKNHLVIAGHWDKRYSLAVSSPCRERVKFIGPIYDADLPALYTGATVFVFPSLYEGFGLPVLEAMACGAPVICSNSAALPETAGAAALFFDPHDEAALAHTLEKVLADADLRADLRARGLERAAQFSWEAVAAVTAQIYRSIISK